MSQLNQNTAIDMINRQMMKLVVIHQSMVDCFLKKYINYPNSVSVLLVEDLNSIDQYQAIQPSVTCWVRDVVDSRCEQLAKGKSMHIENFKEKNNAEVITISKDTDKIRAI